MWGFIINRKFLFFLSFLTLLMIPIIAVVLISETYVIGILYTGVYLFIAYFLYLRYVKRRRTKYPLTPPSGRQDNYFPRTSIPRPIDKDYREHPEYFKKKRETEKHDSV